ncbi:hypothetical protein FACS1894113_4430 [Alphaproteobacteria bacterium]|nr:hypothetical protein FACS1894113_4430 [Alphaproteobacteria bacterium]
MAVSIGAEKPNIPSKIVTKIRALPPGMPAAANFATIPYNEKTRYCEKSGNERPNETSSANPIIGIAKQSPSRCILAVLEMTNFAKFLSFKLRSLPSIVVGIAATLDMLNIPIKTPGKRFLNFEIDSLKHLFDKKKMTRNMYP